MSGYRSRSLWLDDYPLSLEPRPELDGATQVDVAIVGGGYTGLWTAYYLLIADPTIRVVVIERDIVGFGASGRNGGWCVGEIAGGYAAASRVGGHSGAVKLLRAGIDSVDEIDRITTKEGIDCDFHKGGTIRLARNRSQLHQQTAEVASDHQLGLSDDDIRLLDADEAARVCNATSVLGGIYWAACARVHPVKLVRGLAETVERLGGRIAEGTEATDIEPGVVRTDRGDVRADIVVRATEGYTPQQKANHRRLVPLYSLMVATEPLSDEQWNEIGLTDMETFADDRHLVIYGQRTADGRIAFGGRGARYGFGSKIDPAIEQDSATHELLGKTLIELFPSLSNTVLTHRWGGVLGVPRDWFPSVGLDQRSGMAWGGGYVGEGVAISNLHGRTLADLIVGSASELTTLPWVNHLARDWEPEPLRWLAINGSLKLMEQADASEDRKGKPSKRARIIHALRR
ncbi:MAG: FAD-binding oxidoreductase [Acidimicrobiales bacterium]